MPDIPKPVPILGQTDWPTLPDDEELETIRYSLTALGERVVQERRGRRFRGFGPCVGAWAR